MGMSRNSWRRVKKARRGIEALKLREKGMTYREIGQAMHVSEQRAWKLVCDEFDRLLEKRTEKDAHVHKMELMRLDALHQTLWKKAQHGDSKAIGLVLKTMERRAALLGLDVANEKTNPTAVVQLNVQEVLIEKATSGRIDPCKAISAPSEPASLPAV
jgi:hypothetical protein